MKCFGLQVNYSRESLRTLPHTALLFTPTVLAQKYRALNTSQNQTCGKMKAIVERADAFLSICGPKSGILAHFKFPVFKAKKTG